MPKVAQPQSLFNLSWTKYTSKYKVLKMINAFGLNYFLFPVSIHSIKVLPGFLHMYLYPISYWAKSIKHFYVSLLPIQIPSQPKAYCWPIFFLPSGFPHFFYSRFQYPSTPVMKETHHHVLTRTQTERESDAEFQMHLFSPPSPGSHWHPQS